MVKIGDIVHYVNAENQCIASIVTSVIQGSQHDEVTLTGFGVREEPTALQHPVKRSEIKREPGTWHPVHP